MDKYPVPGVKPPEDKPRDPERELRRLWFAVTTSLTYLPRNQVADKLDQYARWLRDDHNPVSETADEQHRQFMAEYGWKEELDDDQSRNPHGNLPL